MRTLLSAFVSFSLLLVTASQLPGQTMKTKATNASSEIENRIDSIIGQMTLEEKIDFIGGVDGFFIRGVPRLNIPRLKMADGPIGVRNFGPATTMAGGIALAATWNTALAERVGTEIGRDARAKGVHFLLAPGVNIYRAPMNGRNFEYFGEDPFLASRITVGYIKGVQSQDVAATVKHFAGNNSEFDRHNTDSVIDERALREIYLPAFEAAVTEAQVGSIMDAYNLTNGTHMTQHNYLNTDVARNEWGFDGVMMSDWTSTYDAVAAANGGLDLEMPSARFMNRENLIPAIQQGKVSIATIDEKVRRILRVAARFGWLDREQSDLSIPRYNPEGSQVALEAARESMVLLKNENGLLPLDKNKIKSIALIGPGAHPAVPVGGGSARVEPFTAVSFLDGLTKAARTGPTVYYHRGLPSFSEMAQTTSFVIALKNGKPGIVAEYFKGKDLEGPPVASRIEQNINYGPGSPASFVEQTLSSRWSGYFVPKAAGPHELFVATTRDEIGGHRLYVDDKLVLDNWNSARAYVGYTTLTLDASPHKIVLEQHGRSTRFGSWMRLGIMPWGTVVEADAKAIARKADAVIIAVGFNPDTESEGADRTFGLPPGQDELIREIAAVNKNSVVVVTAGGSVDTNTWFDRIPALVHAWYPGQEGGTALAQILFGDVNPSGRLPISFERRWQDNPVFDSYYPEAGTNRIVYKEGIFVGYRGYEHKGTQPLFPFGHGLSYTSFRYSNLAIKRATNGTRYEVSFNVQNTGSRAGAEVAQVYISGKQGKTPRPVKELKGFVKVNLRPGEERRVSVTIDERALSYYDVNSKRWHAESGPYEVLVGKSSAQIELRGTLTHAQK